MKLGDLSVGYLLSLQRAIEQAGHEAWPLFQRYRISPETLASADARISIPRFMRLGHAAIHLTGDPALGLRMGQLSQPSHLGLAGMAAQCAPNLYSALHTLTRFERLSSQNYRGHSSFEAPAHRFYSISPYNAFNLFVVDSALSSRAHLGWQLTGGQAQLREVHIEFPTPAYADTYHSLFNCPVLFEQEANQLIWDSASLQLPLQQSAPNTHSHLLQLCEQQLADKLRQRRLGERVAELISPRLHRQLPSLEQVASQLGMAPWTLRRRLLQEEQTRFQDIIDQTRRDLAISYIRDTDLALGEIAFLLGFSSAAAFQRAFRRWTRQPPGQYRRLSHQTQN